VPTLTAQPTGATGVDVRDLLFYDDFSDPTGQCATATTTIDECWGIGDTGGGTIAYTEGELVFETGGDGFWEWSRRNAGSIPATMRVVAEFVPSAAGEFGVLCASGDDQLFGATVTTDGGWSLVTIGGSGAEELVGDADAGLVIPIGEATVMVVECAGLSTGALRVQLMLGRSGPIGIYEADEGPDNFDRAAIYVEASADDFSVRVDESAVFGTASADGQLSASAQELLSHVPLDWQNDCYEGVRPPFFGGTAETIVTCFLASADNSGAEIAEYAAYLSTTALQEAYQARIDTFGVTSEGTCETGPNETTWSIDDVVFGRVQCAPQTVGIRFDWTDERLNILSTLVDLDGSYPETYEQWIEAGPNV
jgi:hypothetical protein